MFYRRNRFNKACVAKSLRNSQLYMVQEIIRVFYKVPEEGTIFADLKVIILLDSVLVELLMENFAMVLLLVAVAQHTETPTPGHLAQRQRYTPESNSHTRTRTRLWYCDLSRNILTTSSRRGHTQLQRNRPQRWVGRRH